MSRIRSKDTKPELTVRRCAHGLGYRYRLHVRSLPGSPDLVFSSRRKVVFVNGCYWHRHRCVKGQPMPATNTKYWTRKFERNIGRDRENRRDLKRGGWEILVIWECQTKNGDKLADRLSKFLG